MYLSGQPDLNWHLPVPKTGALPIKLRPGPCYGLQCNSTQNRRLFIMNEPMTSTQRRFGESMEFMFVNSNTAAVIGAGRFLYLSIAYLFATACSDGRNACHRLYAEPCAAGIRYRPSVPLASLALIDSSYPRKPLTHFSRRGFLFCFHSTFVILVHQLPSHQPR